MVAGAQSHDGTAVRKTNERERIRVMMVLVLIVAGLVVVALLMVLFAPYIR